MPKKKVPLTSLTPDLQNANKGTERGAAMLLASLREVGAGRSILTDKHGRVIAGNKTLEAWADISGETEVVHANGQSLVVVQRDDLDLDEPNGLARKLAYYDNRVNEVDLEWDAAQILADIDAGLDLSSFFFDFEIENLTGHLSEAGNLWEDLPEFENEKNVFRQIVVSFDTDEDVAEFSKLIQQTITPKTKSIWYPKQPHINQKEMLVTDEP